LNEFLEKAEKGASNIRIKSVGGACVFVKMCSDVNETNFVVDNPCVESALKNGTEKGVA